MRRNVGDTDSYVRLAAGVILLLLGIAGYAGMVTVAFGPFPQMLVSVVLALVGVVLLATGYTRKCMAYRLIGADTSE